MIPYVIKTISSPVKGKILLLGDKSIAHRALIVSSLSKGKTRIENVPLNEDCSSTLKNLKKLGIKITQRRRGLFSSAVTVAGKGLWGLKKPKSFLFAGASGTTLRLLLGVLAGQNFQVKLAADKSLSKRPMRRVNEPLRMMGAVIKASRINHQILNEEYLPIIIKGGNLKGITYKMPVASAQVKSAILLAGLYAKGKTCIIERVATRDHTERMLKLFKVDIKVNPINRARQNMIVLKGLKEMTSPKKIYIPADISGAAFFIVLAAIIPGSDILIKEVSLNPSRIGILRVLKRMNARIQLLNVNSLSEPVGDIIVKGSFLKATKIRKEEVPSLIDELPILMVAACFAKGKTVFEGIGELRVKETDRIESMRANLTKMKAHIKVFKSGEDENIAIEGVKQLTGVGVRSFGDHRTAMSMAIAGLAALGKTRIDDISCINKSFPNFINLLRNLDG
ncbi:MAG: 3-phosphoshikimate 1-carboxyvinyltransferase [Candidatus Omnitrophota bacterium]|nr:3-phosphoshikimate 1-carboxyvinyltransferase [Candidatus Omnitrophota bacterium]